MVGAPASARAATYDLPATADTWLRESSPLGIRGLDQELRGQTANLDSERPMLAFGTGAIPPGEYVLDARMILHVSQTDPSVTVDVHPVKTVWLELTANWLLNGSSYESGKPRGTFTPATAGSVSVDVTGLVQQWVSGVKPDCGVMLIPRTVGAQTRFASREWGTSSERPHLVVTTSPAAAGSADLETAIAPSDPAPAEGGPVTWRVVVRNLGKNLATSVGVAAAVPAGLSPVSHSASQGSWASGSGTWTVGSVAAGDSATLAINTTVDAGEAGSRIRFPAAVAGLDQADPAPANDASEASLTVRGGAFRLASGLHFGSGTAGVPVVAGIQPDVVLVKDHGNRPAVLATATMNGRAKVPGLAGAAAGGAITSIDAAGFTLGADVGVNESGRTYHWTAMRAAAGQLIVGDYVGDGTDDRGIGGVGFAPAWVVVAGEGATECVQRFATLTGDSTLAFDGSGPVANRIQSLEADGFEVGTDAAVNAPGTVYHFAAWNAVTAGAAQGSYFGDGSDGRAVAAGFAPGFAAVLRNGDECVFRTGSVTGDATLFFSGTGSGSDRIQALLGTGFELGKNNDVNANSETYHWIALGDSTGPRADLVVTGSASDGTPDPNQAVTLTYRIRNNGPDGAAGIVLATGLPSDLAYQSAVPSQGSFASGLQEWTVGAIAAGDSASIDVLTVVADEPALDSLLARAAVAAVDLPDGSPGDEADSIDVVVNGNDLQVTFAVDDSLPGEGDTVVFRATVRNAGAGTSSSVAAGAALPVGLTGIADSTSQGAWNPGTGGWDVGLLAAGSSADLFVSASVDPGTAGLVLTAAAWADSSSRPDPVAANDSASASVAVTAADLGVTMSVDDPTPDEGDPVTFTVTLRNLGPDAAASVLVTDSLRAGFTFQADSVTQGTYAAGTGQWNAGAVAAGDSASLFLTAVVDSGAAGGALVNFASVTASSPGDPDPSNDADSVQVSVPGADLGVAIAVNDPAPAEADSILFLVNLRNYGPDAATGVSLTQAVPPGLAYVTDVPSRGAYDAPSGAWNVGTIAAGDSATLFVQARVDAGTGGTAILARAEELTADQGDPAPGNDADSVSVAVRSADLRLTNVVSDPSPAPGDTVTYSLAVANFGPDDASGVLVTDVLPAGLAYAGHAAGGGTAYDSTGGTWTIGALGASMGVALQLSASVEPGTAGQGIVNAAAITAMDPTDPDTTTNAASAQLTVRSADLALSAGASNPLPDEGEAISLTFRVSNAGPDTASAVSVSAPVPAGLTWTGDTPSQGTFAPGTGAWDAGTIAPGDSATLDVAATVDPGTAGQALTAAAAVTSSFPGDPAAADDSASVSVTVAAADLAVTKSVNNAGPTVGSTITYTVKVKNLGPDAATNVVVADTLPSGVTYQASAASRGSYATGTKLWTVGTIAASDSASLMLTATVNAGTGGATLTNVASIQASDQGDPGGANDADSVDVNVFAATPVSANLGVAMTLDNAAPDEGDTLSYRITLSNAGPSAASGVIVTDLLPAGLSYDSHVASQGAYDPGTGDWTAGNVMIAGSHTLDVTAIVAAGTAGGTLTNAAAITASAQLDSSPGNNTASRAAVVRAADIAVSVSADTSRASEGDTVVLTWTALNQGPDASLGLVVTGALPAGLTLQGDAASHGAFNAGSGAWTVGALPSATPATLDLTVTVDPGTAGSSLTTFAGVSASGRGDPDASDDADTLALPVDAVDLAVVKTVDAAGADAGDAVTFTVTVRNAGPDSATGVQVADPLPAGLTWQSDVPDRGTYAPGAGLWDVGTIAAGDSAALSIVATVDADTEGRTLVNVAAAAAVTQTDTDPANDADSASVTVRAADLRISQSVDVATPYEGGTVRFAVSVANLGPDSTAGVQILDPLPAGLTFQADSAGQGSYASGPGVWTVGALAAGDSATLALTAGVDPGTAGQTLWNVASVGASSRGDPVPANDTDSLSVTVSEGVLLLASQPPSGAVLPGEADAHLFSLSLANTQPSAVTLDQMAVRNTTSGPGTQAQRDAELGTLTLWRDDGDLAFDPRTDTPLSSATASAGSAVFGGLSLAVPSGAIASLFVGTDVGLAAKDSDVLDVEIAGPGSVSFGGAVTFLNAWPLAPAPSYPVDGMARAQIAVTALPGGTMLTGARDALAMEAVLPADGYAGDTLQQLRVRNLGTAVTLLDLTAVELWSDGGNGTFDAGLGDDNHRGAASWTGSDWRWPGLSVPVPPAGLPVFVSVDVSPLATPGRTVRFEIPSSPAGVTVASANDGPIDGPVAGPATFTLQQAPSVVTARGAAQTGGPVLPAGPTREILRFELVNTAAVAETLAAVTFANTTSGPGTQAELDAEWEQLSLTTLSRIGIGVGGARAAGVTFSGGQAAFTGLGARIPAGDTLTVILEAAVSAAARDGDVLDVAVSGPASVAFTDGGVQVTGTFPLAPPAGFPVDGMSSAQVAVPDAIRLPGSLLTGSTRNVSLLADIPANGYEPDTLRYVNLENHGDAAAGTDIAAMELWHDFDGDGSPEPRSDDAAGRLGALVFTGNRWEITGLAHPVPAGGARLFVTTDVADLAIVGSTVRLAFPASPDFGLGMQSANDGPVDAEAPADSLRVTQPISTADRVTLSTTLLSPGSVSPGQALVPLLRVHATNDYSVPKTLTALAVTNRTTGSGTLAQRDSEVGQLRLRADSLGGAELGKTVFSGGAAGFSGFSLTLGPGETRDLVVAADVSATLAADGDVLDAEIADEGEVTFSDPTTVVAGWPLTSNARWTINGMLAAQITNHGAPPATLGPGEGPALALNLTLPSNGYAADVLRGLTVVNDSTATPSDVAQMRLWRDGGDGTFDAGAGDDTDLGAMTPVGGNWVSPALSASVPPGGIRCFVSIVAATADATVRLAVPVGGVAMESGNDGPIDARIVNPDAITLSTAALLADLEITPDKSTLGSSVLATMTVRNLGDSTIVGIVPPGQLESDNPAVLSFAFGPVPPSADLAPGADTTFTWTYAANNPGIVRLTGGASGTESGSGLTRQTPDATSGAHQVFVEAQELELFPVQSMPFSVSQGQAGVVPLSLTLTNLAPAGGSPVRITRVAFRLEDGTGTGIVPAAVLKRVLVNEGTNVYADKSAALEITGDTVDLPLSLAPVLVPPGSGQVTLSLSLDVSDSTVVPEFRLEIPASSWIDAEDATSGAPVTISLAPPETYPVESGLASVVTEAAELQVQSAGGAPVTAGPGQPDVRFLGLSLLSPDPDSLAADVRVSRLEVVLEDGAGAAVTQPALYLSRIRVSAAFQPLLDRMVTAADDSTITLALSPLLSVPANAPVPLTVQADVHADPPLGPLRMRLAGAAGFDARDANSGNVISVSYQSDPVAGPVVTLVAPADTIRVTGRPRLPETLPVGTADQPALTLVLRHPGGPETGAVSLEAVTLECLDQADQPLVPATYVDRARALRGGTEIGIAPNPPSSGGSFALPLGGTMLAPGETDSVEIRFDVEVTAPADLFRFRVSSGAILAFDTSLGLTVAAAADSGASFPLTSGLTRLESPARTLAVGFTDAMPPVLAADGGTVTFATMGLGNPAAPTAGAIVVNGLTVRAADADYAPLSLGAAVARVEAWMGSALWAASGDLPADAVTADLVAGQPVVLPPGPPRGLELRAVMRAGAALSGLRLGFAAADVHVLQPPGQLLQVAVLAADGQTFPFWTEAGNFSSASLEESWSNFPNPFAAGRQRTTFAFYLPQPGQVTLKLWTARGKAVRTLLDATALPAGLHQDRNWDGRNGRGETVTNGVYLAEIVVRYEDGTTARTLRKVAVVR